MTPAAINALVLLDAHLLGLLPEAETSWAKLPAKIREPLAKLVQSLQDASPFAAATAIWNELVAHSARKFGRYEALDLDPYRDRKAIFEWCARLDREHEQSAALAAPRQRTHAG